MSGQLPDELVSMLLEAIEDTGQKYAKAKRRQEELKERRKITKNTLMKFAEADGVRTQTKQEVFAYTHPQYDQVVRDWMQAIEDEAIAEVRFKNAEREWESWRTISANERSVR